VWGVLVPTSSFVVKSFFGARDIGPILRNGVVSQARGQRWMNQRSGVSRAGV